MVQSLNFERRSIEPVHTRVSSPATRKLTVANNYSQFNGNLHNCVATDDRWRPRATRDDTYLTVYVS